MQLTSLIDVFYMIPSMFALRAAHIARYRVGNCDGGRRIVHSRRAGGIMIERTFANCAAHSAVRRRHTLLVIGIIIDRLKSCVFMLQS